MQTFSLVYSNVICWPRVEFYLNLQDLFFNFKGKGLGFRDKGLGFRTNCVMSFF